MSHHGMFERASSVAGIASRTESRATFAVGGSRLAMRARIANLRCELAPPGSSTETTPLITVARSSSIRGYAQARSRRQLCAAAGIGRAGPCLRARASIAVCEQVGVWHRSQVAAALVHWHGRVMQHNMAVNTDAQVRPCALRTPILVHRLPLR